MTTTPDGETVVLAYRLYGLYSFKVRDGGVPVRLALLPGYSVGEWIDGSLLIVGLGQSLSVEKAIYHGVARVLSD